MTPRPPVRASAPALLHRLTAKVLAGSGSFIERLCKGKIESASGVTVGAVWVLTAPVFFLCSAVDFSLKASVPSKTLNLHVNDTMRKARDLTTQEIFNYLQEFIVET